MANTKNDVAQQATKWYLTEVGRRYDDARGFAQFRPTTPQLREVLNFFNHACVYCLLPISNHQLLKDHLIPLNRTSGGLHAWGNVFHAVDNVTTQKEVRSGCPGWLPFGRTRPQSDLRE